MGVLLSLNEVFIWGSGFVISGNHFGALSMNVYAPLKNPERLSFRWPLSSLLHVIEFSILSTCAVCSVPEYHQQENGLCVCVCICVHTHTTEAGWNVYTPNACTHYPLWYGWNFSGSSLPCKFSMFHSKMDVSFHLIITEYILANSLCCL